MNRDYIIRMAIECQLVTTATRDGLYIAALERFFNAAYAAGAAAEREKVARWMRNRSYATGHGDTVEDLLNEMEWQIKEIRARGSK